MKNRILEEKRKEIIEVGDVVKRLDNLTCLIIEDENTYYPYRLLDLDLGKVIIGYARLEAINDDINIELVCKGKDLEIRRID